MAAIKYQPNGTFRTTKPALGAGFVVIRPVRDNFRTFSLRIRVQLKNINKDALKQMPYQSLISNTAQTRTLYSDLGRCNTTTALQVNIVLLLAHDLLNA
jgi:hypothetical protein